MNILEAIRQRLLKFLKIDKVPYDPTSDRLTFINDLEAIESAKLKEYKAWYIGNGSELLNLYTNKQLWDNAKNPIYNRNKQNYFWGLSSTECDIKRVHSGIPKEIINTLVNSIGDPKINCDLYNDKLDKIITQNDLLNIIKQQQLPLTCVEGWGAFKININKELRNVPIIQYYEAENVEFAYKSNVLCGVIFKDYYQQNNKDYVLIETRRRENGNSRIEYELFLLKPNKDVEPVPLDTIEGLEGLENVEIVGLDEVLAVPSKFFYDPYAPNYGRSIFSNKIDLFDDLDQILSQDSQTVRVSTPVEYYPEDLLEHLPNGDRKAPSAYNRQYIKKPSIPGPNGETDGTIQTTQPELNFAQYSEEAVQKLKLILTGLISPATLGFDVSAKDNAEAQREKEKVTINTRNNIIDRETPVLKQLLKLCLMCQEYMEKGYILNFDYDISITYDEFANPSFENELKILGPAWTSGQISTERYVELLWGDKLSDEDRLKEIEALERERTAVRYTFE